MKILAFDISSNQCAISILDDKGMEIGSFYEEMVFGQAEALIPAISDCLGEIKVDISEIDLIGVTVGPGSFTGIRAGIATARSLALALEVPAIGISTLRVFFEQQSKRKDKNLVVVETKRADFYYQIFDKCGVELCKAGTGFSKDIIKEVGGNCKITGDGKARFISEIGVDGSLDNIKIKSETIGKIALKEYLANKEKIDGDRKKFYPSPLYLRAATVRK